MKRLPSFINLTNCMLVSVWVLCSSLLLYLFKTVFEDYNEQNPVTVITFVDRTSTPVNIKICNENYLDRRKILNKSNPDYEHYQFLTEAMLGNEKFNDSNRIINWFSGTFFLLSSNVLQYLALDLNEFLLACLVKGLECSKQFHLYPELFTPCYEATIDMQHFDKNNGISLVFHFDPNITLGKYSDNVGAYIRIAHKEQYIPILEGITRTI